MKRGALQTQQETRFSRPSFCYWFSYYTVLGGQGQTGLCHTVYIFHTKRIIVTHFANMFDLKKEKMTLTTSTDISINELGIFITVGPSVPCCSAQQVSPPCSFCACSPTQYYRPGDIFYPLVKRPASVPPNAMDFSFRVCRNDWKETKCFIVLSQTWKGKSLNYLCF